MMQTIGLMSVPVKRCLLLLGCTFMVFLCYAQPVQQKTSLSQIWAGYFNQSRFNKKWGLWLDVQVRTKDNLVDSLLTVVFRPGLTYYIGEHSRLTTGYAYMNHFPADNPGNISQPEHRFWQQFQWTKNYTHIQLSQRIRLEERFRRKFNSPDELADDNFFNYRFRYSVGIQVPLTRSAFKKGSLSAVVNDEIMVNFGKQVVYNVFDQNRLLIGLNYYFQDNKTLLLAYMNQYQQLASGNLYVTSHVLRLAFMQSIDFRKTENKPSN